MFYWNLIEIINPFRARGKIREPNFVASLVQKKKYQVANHAKIRRGKNHVACQLRTYFFLRILQFESRMKMRKTYYMTKTQMNFS